MQIHIVQEGESLWSIANKYEIDFEQLRLENKQVERQDDLFPGMKIYIPVVDGGRKKPFLSERIMSNETDPKKRKNKFTNIKNQTSEKENNHFQEKSRLHEHTKLRKAINQEQMICCYCMQPLRGSVQQHIPYQNNR